MVQWNYQELEIDNPSFEGEPVNRGGNLVAAGWVPWWSTEDPPLEESQGPCQAPEYKVLDASRFPYRVTDGEQSQCWFLRWKVYDGGLYQFVEVPAGIEFVQLAVDGQAYCSNGDDPRRSEGEMYLAVGIDLYGRLNPSDLGVIWSPWWPVGAQYQRIDGPIAKLLGRTITIYIRAWPKWKMSHCDVIVDNATLYGITLRDEGDGGTPPPPPPVDYDEIERRVHRQLQGLVLGSIEE